MKKSIFFSAFAAIALLTSCGKGSPSASMNNSVDTISYELGMVIAPEDDQLNAYLAQMGSDSTHSEEFLKGLRDGISVGDDKAKSAYYQGLQAGMNIKMQTIAGVENQIFGNDSTKKLNVKNVIAGIFDVRAKKTKLKMNGKAVSREEAGNDLQARIETEAKRIYSEKYAEAKKKNEAYMAQVAKDAAVRPAGNGVFYKVIKEGSGAMPKPTDVVEVRYTGKLIDGKVFDSTGENTAPLPLQQMIKGFSTALVKMPVGSKWEIYIPYNLGYGELGQGPVTPFSTLIFEVELAAIQAPAATPAK